MEITRAIIRFTVSQRGSSSVGRASSFNLEIILMKKRSIKIYFYPVTVAGSTPACSTKK